MLLHCQRHSPLLPSYTSAKTLLMHKAIIDENCDGTRSLFYVLIKPKQRITVRYILFFYMIHCVTATRETELLEEVANSNWSEMSTVLGQPGSTWSLDSGKLPWDAWLSTLVKADTGRETSFGLFCNSILAAVSVAAIWHLFAATSVSIAPQSTSCASA